MVGFNDVPYLSRLSPPLTPISFPRYQVGIEAVQLVRERIDNASATAKVLLLAPALAVRGSTAVVSSY